jgi:hypothetical protein
MRRKDIHMEDRVERLVERVLKDSGDNPIVFLDTGAIIDFEKEVLRRWKLVDSSATTPKFYNLMANNGFPIYVTDHIYGGEVVRHQQCNSLNGNPEISHDTFEIVTDMHNAYCNFLRSIDGNAFDIEEVRYATYTAGLEAFEEGHKKKCIDPISRVDRELVASALWARYATLPSVDSIESKPISTSTIVSPDCHISGTSKVLMSKEYGYEGLRTISSR